MQTFHKVDIQKQYNLNQHQHSFFSQLRYRYHQCTVKIARRIGKTSRYIYYPLIMLCILPEVGHLPRAKQHTQTSECPPYRIVWHSHTPHVNGEGSGLLSISELCQDFGQFPSFRDVTLSWNVPSQHNANAFTGESRAARHSWKHWLSASVSYLVISCS